MEFTIKSNFFPVSNIYVVSEAQVFPMEKSKMVVITSRVPKVASVLRKAYNFKKNAGLRISLHLHSAIQRQTKRYIRNLNF